MAAERPHAVSTAIALLSGGLDSATAAALAIEAGDRVIGLSFDYGQRHRRELEAAAAVAAALGLAEHHTIAVNLAAWGGSSLTDASQVIPSGGVEAGVIPSTYVPSRNTVFIAIGLSLAEARGAGRLVLGVNAVDYSGYPDCRPDYMQAFERVANLATKAAVEGSPLSLHTPIIELTKADIIRRGVALGVDYALTVSCYQADAAGRACGRCDSCRIRRAGFEAAGVPDPTRYAV